MSYLIKCKKCQFSITADNPKLVKFCGGCGGFLKYENAEGEQPFHRREDDPGGVNSLNKIKKALGECFEILKAIQENDSSTREESREILDGLNRDILGNLAKDENTISLDDPKWFQKLKDIK